MVSIIDDRLGLDLFWTADDQILTAGNFGTFRAWDSTTLEAASDDPVGTEESGCSGGNGMVFDPTAAALFLQSDGPCRIDITTGELVQSSTENRTTLLAVAIGGNTTSAAGGYYLARFNGGKVVVSSSDGSTVGAIENPSGGALKTAWSPDETVLVTRADEEISVYRLG